MQQISFCVIVLCIFSYGSAQQLEDRAEENDYYEDFNRGYDNIMIRN